MLTTEGWQALRDRDSHALRVLCGVAPVTSQPGKQRQAKGSRTRCSSRSATPVTHAFKMPRTTGRGWQRRVRTERRLTRLDCAPPLTRTVARYAASPIGCSRCFSPCSRPAAATTRLAAPCRRPSPLSHPPELGDPAGGTLRPSTARLRGRSAQRGQGRARRPRSRRELRDRGDDGEHTTLPNASPPACSMARCGFPTRC